MVENTIDDYDEISLSKPLNLEGCLELNCLECSRYYEILQGFGYGFAGCMNKEKFFERINPVINGILSIEDKPEKDLVLEIKVTDNEQSINCPICGHIIKNNGDLICPYNDISRVFKCKECGQSLIVAVVSELIA